MKKIFISLLLIMTAFGSIAQKCDYYENTVDAMTKDTLVSTWAKVAQTFTQGMVFTYKKLNSSYFIRMGYGLSGYQAIVIGKDAELMIKLQNDSIITLKSTDIVTADINTANGIGESKITCFYRVEREQLEAIKQHKLKLIRFYTTDGYIEMEAFTKKKKVANNDEAIDCLLKHTAADIKK